MLQFIIQAIHSTKLNGGLVFTENDKNGQIYAPRTQPNRTGQVDISIKTIKKKNPIHDIVSPHLESIVFLHALINHENTQ